MQLGPRLGLGRLSRQQITITNAWAGIEYESKTGRSEASDGEVSRAENIRRLADELRDVKMLIVFCGDKAKLASSKLREGRLVGRLVQIALVPHLGSQGLNNSIKVDLTDQLIVDAGKQRREGRRDSLKFIQRENTRRRLEVVVERLLASRVPAQLDAEEQSGIRSI